MRQFTVIPLSKEYIRSLKERNTDDFGNPLVEQISSGYGPCRVSLKPFEAGKDKRLLFSYSPFSIKNAFYETGPVVVHQKDVESYTDIHRFPPEIKADKVNFPLSLTGYSRSQKMVFTKLVGDADVEDLIEETFLQHPEIAYFHVRNAEACCFICKIERRQTADE